MDLEGDFSVTYDMSMVDDDYYKNEAHWAYSYGRRPLTLLENLLLDEEKRIFFIRESFSNSVIPFLNLGIKYVTAIDPLQFTGSIRKCIESAKPDVVCILYTGAGGHIDWDTHTSYYDFR